MNSELDRETQLDIECIHWFSFCQLRPLSSDLPAVCKPFLATEGWSLLKCRAWSQGQKLWLGLDYWHWTQKPCSWTHQVRYHRRFEQIDSFVPGQQLAMEFASRHDKWPIGRASKRFLNVTLESWRWFAAFLTFWISQLNQQNLSMVSSHIFRHFGNSTIVIQNSNYSADNPNPYGLVLLDFLFVFDDRLFTW